MGPDLAQQNDSSSAIAARRLTWATRTAAVLAIAIGAVPLVAALLPASAGARDGSTTPSAMAASGLVLGGLALLLQRRGGAGSPGAGAPVRPPDAEEALRRSEAMLNTLIETLPVGVIVADAQGRVVRDNAATRELWGVPPETTSWESYGEWVGWFPETGERIRGDEWAMARALRFGETTRGQLVENQRFGTGDRRLYLQNVVPLRDQAGEIVGAVGAMLDVTDRRQAQAAVHEANARLRLALDAARMVAWEYDPATREVVLSDNAEEVLQLPRRHGTSEEGFGLIHPEDVEGHRLKVATAIETGGSYVSVYRHAHGGQAIWLEEHGRAVLDAAGRTSRLVGVVQNVTARKAAEEALRESDLRFRSVLENMSEGVMLFDADANLTYQNPGSLRIHGFDPASDGRIRREALSVTWKAWDESGRAITFDEWPVSRVFRGERFQDQVLRVERVETGRVFYGSYNGSPVLDEHGRITIGFITIRDITEQISAADALREANERLLEADRRKDAFLAVLSHELRNPLAPIRNSVYVLERTEPGGERASRAIAVIDRQVNHMARLIEDLLDVSRISRGKVRLQYEPVELGEIVQHAAEDFRALFAANGIAFEATAGHRPLRARVDRTRIAQVVGNLLQNAAKFTPRGGRVLLSLRPGEDGWALITVRDTGIGLDPAMLERLFEPFVQGDASLERTNGGLGLGLALVRGLVELHGGSVSVASEGRDRGAEIRVLLPLETAEAPVAAPGSQAPNATAGRRRRVLLIEDNPDAAETLKAALELNGHEVDTARDGVEGLQMARALGPDVVLCDIGLPGLDGYEVARRMRDDPLLRRACLVALSGYAAPDDLERSRQAGFVRHLAKPPDLAALERTLSELCPPVN